jgi:hypothetical protein
MPASMGRQKYYNLCLQALLLFAFGNGGFTNKYMPFNLKQIQAHGLYRLYRLVKMKEVISLLVCILLSFPIVTVACDDNPSSHPLFFPVLNEPESIYPNALARGRLVLDHNCLRLKRFYFFGKGSLLIWPYGYSVETQNKKISVVDNNGEVIARVGDWLKVGGGEIPKEIVEKYIGKPLSDNYTGPYWLAAGVIKD